MKMAQIIAESSHCISQQVGAVIVKNDRIISMGYNGTPAGYKNCDDVWNERGDEHSAWSQDHEIHAEMNAIIYAAKAGISIEGAIMYTTLSPCRNCLKHIKQSGIVHIYYKDRYLRTTDEQHAADLIFLMDLGHLGLTKMSS